MPGTIIMANAAKQMTVVKRKPTFLNDKYPLHGNTYF